MPIGVYETAVLNGVVDSLIRPQTALLDKYFREESISDDETIYFDMEDSARRIAPFVHPTLAGKLVEGLVPDTVPLGTVQKVLQNLLEENIPARDIRTISEATSREPRPNASEC